MPRSHRCSQSAEILVGPQGGCYYLEPTGKKKYVKPTSERLSEIGHVLKEGFPPVEEKDTSSATYFDHVPADILYLILLKKNPKELKCLCKINYRFSLLCNTASFQKEYKGLWGRKTKYSRQGEILKKAQKLFLFFNPGALAYFQNLLEPIETELINIPPGEEAIAAFISSLPLAEDIWDGYLINLDRERVIKILIEKLLAFIGSSRVGGCSLVNSYRILAALRSHGEVYKFFQETLKKNPIPLDSLCIRDLHHLIQTRRLDMEGYSPRLKKSELIELIKIKTKSSSVVL